jgi:hypothetical protein
MPSGRPLTAVEKLACLAVRLGLDFRATSLTERAEREQVERHMRLCLSATPGFHNMVTISASEPLLAEAAHQVMATYVPMDDVPKALLEHIDSSNINAGDRGEVIATLLLLLSRDKVIASPKRKKPFPGGEPSGLENDGGKKGRILTVLELLGALIPTAAGADVRNQKPFRATAESREKKLEDAFSDAHVWFNHFIKIHDFDVVNRQYLWRLISRGAALVCANNHRGGIDIVIPILFGIYLKPEFVSAIFI